MYCGYCLVFSKSGCFSTSGYIDWKNAVGDKRGNFKKHEQCKQHQDAQQQATEFLRVCDSKERKDVYSFLSTAYKEKIERNRKILLSIVDSIIEKCKEAPFFSLCADETTDVSVTEQLSLCVRYIDQSTMEVCEDFLGYMRLEKCDAESIAGVITETLQK